MPSLLSTICIAGLAACATLSQASVIPEKRAAGDIQWSGVLSNGTTIHLSGSFTSIQAQVFAMDPDYKAAPAPSAKKRVSPSDTNCSPQLPKGIRMANNKNLYDLAQNLIYFGGDCALTADGHNSWWINDGEAVCISWINNSPTGGETIAPCAGLGQFIASGVEDHCAPIEDGDAQMAVSVDEGWFLVGAGDCITGLWSGN